MLKTKAETAKDVAKKATAKPVGKTSGQEKLDNGVTVAKIPEDDDEDKGEEQQGTQGEMFGDEKKEHAEKAEAKKPAKKPEPKKPVAKKPVAKKPVAKKPVAKKPEPKKSATKPVAKKPEVKEKRVGGNAMKILKVPSDPIQKKIWDKLGHFDDSEYKSFSQDFLRLLEKEPYSIRQMCKLVKVTRQRLWSSYLAPAFILGKVYIKKGGQIHLVGKDKE